MSRELTAHLATVASDHTPLWIDGWQYGQQLLNKGDIAPWDDTGALVSFVSKLQSLLKSDVVTIEVGDFYRFWLESNPQLVTAMGEKRRLGYALRTQLGDQSARHQLHELLRALAVTLTDVPLVLAMPAPRSWMGEAHGNARGLGDVAVTWDDAESGAMYVADFLRIFSDCDLSGILLRDTKGFGPESAEDVARYQPVINVAANYHWQVTLDGCAPNSCEACDSGIALSIGEVGGSSLAKLPASDWTEDTPPALVEELGWYVEIPGDAVPERVLERLAELR